MGTFGENLRREREMRGVSLEEICDATKISVRMLQAMEADQFDKLPGGIFTRSFVRAYVRYLGLDEDTMMAELQLAAPASAQPADLGRMNLQRPPREEQPSRSGPLAALVALLILAGGFAYYRLERRQSKLQPSPARAASQPAPAATSPTTAASTSLAPGAAGAPEVAKQPLTPPGTAAAPASAAADGLVLQVAATEESWVAVECDGKPATQRTLEPNEIQTFRANSSFDLITGNAEGIILTLNGKTLDPLGHRGETKKVHLTSKNVPGAAP